MRESQYVEQYLDLTETKPVTPGTFLAYTLRGHATTWAGRYRAALGSSLDRRVREGLVEMVPSLRGGIAYRRVNSQRRSS